MSGLGDKPAFPEAACSDSLNGVFAGHELDYMPGMTYREYLFAKVLAGFAASSAEFKSDRDAVLCALVWTDMGLEVLVAPPSSPGGGR